MRTSVPEIRPMVNDQPMMVLGLAYLRDRALGFTFGGTGAALRGLERGGDRLIHALEPNELEVASNVFRNVVEVLAIAGRQHDATNAGERRGDDLLLDPAHRQHQPAQADLAGHRRIAAN